MQINTNYDNLEQSYLFSTIARKVREYSASHPEADIIRLGIGDVTRPLVPAVIDALHAAVEDQAKQETFHGYGDEQGYVGVKQERFGGDDDVRPKFPDSPAELSTLGEPTYRLHQALIALRRRNPWLMDARTEAVKLENKHFVYRSMSADAQHSLTVDLNIEQSPTFTIRNADGSTAYQY